MMTLSPMMGRQQDPGISGRKDLGWTVYFFESWRSSTPVPRWRIPR